MKNKTSLWIAALVGFVLLLPYSAPLYWKFYWFNYRLMEKISNVMMQMPAYETIVAEIKDTGGGLLIVSRASGTFPCVYWLEQGQHPDDAATARRIRTILKSLEDSQTPNP